MLPQTHAEYGNLGCSGGGKPVLARFIEPTHRKTSTATLNKKRTLLSRHALYQSIMMVLPFFLASGPPPGFNSVHRFRGLLTAGRSPHAGALASGPLIHGCALPGLRCRAS